MRWFAVWTTSRIGGSRLQVRTNSSVPKEVVGADQVRRHEKCDRIGSLAFCQQPLLVHTRRRPTSGSFRRGKHRRRRRRRRRRPEILIDGLC
jgi:hypothetical protein